MLGNETFVVCGDVGEVKKPLNASTYILTKIYKI